MATIVQHRSVTVAQSAADRVDLNSFRMGDFAHNAVAKRGAGRAMQPLCQTQMHALCAVRESIP